MPRESSLKGRSKRYDSSGSSDSDYSQKSSKRKYKSDRSKRSRSREKSYRRRRSTSRTKKKYRRGDSKSPIKYYSSKKRSLSRERSSRRKQSRSQSRERSYDRSKSHSRDRSDYSKGKYKKSSSSQHKSSRRSSSRSASPYSSREATISYETSKKYIEDDTESKIEKAIKAAEAAGLTMCKLPTYEYKDVDVKEEMPTMQDRIVLDELNSDNFTPKQFTSSRSKKVPDNIVIDLDACTVKVPEVEIPKVESLFHPDLFQDEKTRMERWVKKLYMFRQRALKGEL